MAKVPNGVETLPNISTGGVGRMNVTDRQTDRLTDRRTDDDIANAKSVSFLSRFYVVYVFFTFLIVITLTSSST